MKKICYVSLLLVGLFLFSCNFFASKASDANLVKATQAAVMKEKNMTESEKILRQMMYSYYMRGVAIQYNTLKRSLFSPEEATGQNINYMVCSALPYNIYRELFNISIPAYTVDLLKYTRANLGRPEVIAYGKVDNGVPVMSFYDKNSGKQPVVKTGPNIKDLLPYLRYGDILTAASKNAGHTIMVYDLVYDNSGNITDAYMIECGYSYVKNIVNTKIAQKVFTPKNIQFGSPNHLLHHTAKINETNEGKLLEGSLHLFLLSQSKSWGKLENMSPKLEFSVLRFIHTDSDGNIVLNYAGNSFDSKVIRITDKNIDRLKFEKLYIEKTIDVHADNVVQPKDVLTYTVTVKNNSNKKYNNNIKIKEFLSEFVTYVDNKISKKTISFARVNDDRLEWDIGKLNAGESVSVSYSVSVNDNCIGKTIESKGMVEHIPSAVVKNVVGNKLTEEQKNVLKDTFNKLKNQYHGKKLINEVYRQAVGKDLQFDRFSVTDLVVNNNLASIGYSTVSLNKLNSFYGMVLNKYWSGLATKAFSFKTKNDIVLYDMKVWPDYTSLERRADTVYGETFQTGDVLIYQNTNDVKYQIKNGSVNKIPVTFENGEYAYIFIIGKGFVGVNYGADGISGTVDDRNEFNVDYYNRHNLKLNSNPNENDEEEDLNFANYQTLFGKNCYVILRPALGL